MSVLTGLLLNLIIPWSTFSPLKVLTLNSTQVLYHLNLLFLSHISLKMSGIFLLSIQSSVLFYFTDFHFTCASVSKLQYSRPAWRESSPVKIQSLYTSPHYTQQAMDRHWRGWQRNNIRRIYRHLTVFIKVSGVEGTVVSIVIKM